MNSCNSMTSGFSEIFSPKNTMYSIDKKISYELEHKINIDDRSKTVGNFSKNSKNQKEIYREFVKIFLKVKFERLDNDHTGQKISQNFVWKEVQKQNIPKDKWKEFILGELKNIKKYEDLKLAEM